MQFLIAYLILVNAAGFLLMLADKRKAQKNQWRIPETTLLLTALLGGSLGTVMGMRLFRHKTRHLHFSLGLPVLLALHIIGLVLLISNC
jgi:uncharacterized membrane protein YsdA (DUF1294 family)